VVLTVVFSPVADMGAVYLVSALVLGAAFGAMVEAVRRQPTERTAMRLFSFSITYVTLLFGAMVVDVLVRMSGRDDGPVCPPGPFGFPRSGQPGASWPTRLRRACGRRNLRRSA